MEQLDLTRHDPEDYLGKAVLCHGGEYIIGPHLGTGAERIVHRLINQQSGLGLLVIKIRRWQLPKDLYPAEIAKLRSDPRRAQIIPITHEVDIPGGTVELQPYCGGGPPEDTFADDLDAGYEALQREGYDVAVSHYERVLASLPAHTVAMINLAAAVRGRGDVARASSLARRAVAIEPNLFLYRQVLVTYTAEANNLRLALDDFKETQAVFSHVHDLYDRAIELYLFCGEPEEAQALVGDAMVDKERRATLSEQVSREIVAKASADEWMAAAQGYVERKKWQSALDVLQRGYAVYSKDRLLNVNLALALARAGEPHRAAGLLAEAAFVVADWCAPVCFANAAYCLVDAGELTTALVLLEHLARVLTLYNHGQMPINPADLPGVAIWVSSDHWAEERLHTATERIERALMAVPKGQQPSELVPVLAEAYRRGCLKG